MAELIAHECANAPTGETYVLISKNHNAELGDAHHQLARTPNQILWVLPTYDYKMTEKFEDSQLHILHWEVNA